MPLISISCLTADELFPVPVWGCATDPSIPLVSPNAGLVLAMFYGLPLAEMVFDILEFVESAAPFASDGGMLVGFVWADGVRYEISC